MDFWTVSISFTRSRVALKFIYALAEKRTLETWLTPIGFSPISRPTYDYSPDAKRPQRVSKALFCCTLRVVTDALLQAKALPSSILIILRFRCFIWYEDHSVWHSNASEVHADAYFDSKGQPQAVLAVFIASLSLLGSVCNETFFLETWSSKHSHLKGASLKGGLHLSSLSLPSWHLTVTLHGAAPFLLSTQLPTEDAQHPFFFEQPPKLSIIDIPKMVAITPTQKCLWFISNLLL